MSLNEISFNKDFTRQRCHEQLEQTYSLEKNDNINKKTKLRETKNEVLTEPTYPLEVFTEPSYPLEKTKSPKKTKWTETKNEVLTKPKILVEKQITKWQQKH